MRIMKKVMIELFFRERSENMKKIVAIVGVIAVNYIVFSLFKKMRNK